MEIERLKALEMYAQREAKQKQDRRLTLTPMLRPPRYPSS